MAFVYSDVLAGPIVRRIEPRLVSVWLALRKPAKVKLRIWEGLEFGGTTATPVGEVEVDSLPLGAGLHLALPVLESFTPPGRLKNDTIYSYDLVVREPNEASGKGMLALGLLDKQSSGGVTLHEPLGYEKDRLPGFLLPASDINRARLLQASCRIPHSQIEDAMALMDDAFTAEEQGTGRKAYQFPDLRPQQLFLTGDQIYADEVSPLFLELINKVGVELLSGDPNVVLERLPFEHEGQVHDVPLTCALFPPGRRQRITFQRAGMTSSAGGSHLMGFSEFAAMYLLCWSSVLWPADFFQTRLADRWQRASGYLAEWKALMAELNAKDDLSDKQKDLIREKIACHGAWQLLPEEWRAIDHFLEPDDKAQEWGSEDTAGIPVNLHPDTTAGVSGNIPHAGALPAEVKRELARSLSPSWFTGVREMGFGIREEDDLQSDQVLTHLRGLQLFLAGLPKVRRLLANVATYMMFDDHEVTDDWNLFQEWVEKVQGNLLGLSIVRNGMLAYGLFQGWGNDPLYFAGRQPGGTEVNETPGTEMLEDAPRLFFDDNQQPKPGPDTAAVVHLHKLFNLRTNDPTSPEERVRWHYRVGGNGYEVLSLDIRTFRGFKGPREAPQLMTPAAIADQIPADPIFSNGAPPPGQGVTFVISGMPVLGFPPVVNFVQPLVNLTDDIKPPPEPPFTAAKADYAVGIYAHEPEPWAFQEDAWEALLARFANYGRVVFFSGENHYSYAMQLDYWRYLPDGSPRDATRFLQFTSSASKNFPGKGTAFIFRSGFSGRLADLMGQPQERMGWITAGQPDPPLMAPPDKSFNRLVQRRLQNSPAVIPLTALPPGTTRRYNAEWAWRGDLVREARPDSERFKGVSNVPQFVEPAPGGKFGAPSAIASAQRQFWQSIRGPSRVITFPSSFGLITIDTVAPDPVVHYQVHFVLRETFDTKAKAYTHYTIPLNASVADAPEMPPLAQGVSG